MIALWPLLILQRLERDIFVRGPTRVSTPDNLHSVESSKLLRINTLKASAVLVCILLICAPSRGQQIDDATANRNIDAAVKARIDHIAGYTDTEHYKVFRSKDETHPIAEMVVKTTYRAESGKNYQVLSKGGSAILYRFLLQPLLDTEADINNPAKVGASLMVSANYDMKLKTGSPVQQDGRECWALAIVPRRKAPNLIEGTLWVDVQDFTIVRIEGVTSKSPSFWAAPAHVRRQYMRIDGFPEAIHARAESDSFFGKAVITIDYEGYQIQSR
jgi:hypothetical protein